MRELDPRLAAAVKMALGPGKPARDFLKLAPVVPLQKPGIPSGGGDVSEQKPALMTSDEFTRNFIPPDYLIDGMLQRRFLYSLTAPTGSGKTAIMLRLAYSIALCQAIGRYQIEAAGPVCYLAGENPDDVRMRWIAMSEELGFDRETIDVHFIEGIFKLEGIKEEAARKAMEIGCEWASVLVDTNSAYFQYADENSNTDAGKQGRLLRSLVKLPGGPTVIAACHPTKTADPDNLLPRGGGAFVAEMDGNLVCRKSGTVTEMRWQGKFRGVDFDPIAFNLPIIRATALRDSKDRIIPTVRPSRSRTPSMAP
jgi:AAA domain